MPYEIDRNEGWNAGARSKKVCAGDCQLRFSLPSSNAGACVGLSTSDNSANFREIKYAILAQRVASTAVAFVYEAGEQKAALGSFVSEDIFTIRRNGATIRYYKNGVLVYTSLVNITAPLFVDTSLYAGGDRV